MFDNVDIALSEYIVKLKGTGVGFSRRALLDLRKSLKINGINGKSENILIILVIAPKITGEIFFLTSITCEIMFRSDLLKNNRSYRT